MPLRQWLSYGANSENPMRSSRNTHRSGRQRTTSFSHNRAPTIEPLESRTLLAATLPLVGVYTGRASASETDPTGAGRGSFLIKRAVKTSKALTVQYYVAKSSTAKNTADFRTLSGTMTIPANKYSGIVHIIPVNDATVEGTEIVTLVVKPGSYTIGHAHSSVNIADNDNAPSGWLDTSRRYRSAFTVNSGSFARTNQPIDHAINFTDILSDVGASGSLIKNSIHVVETNAAGSGVIDNSVPFQFDQDAGYNASSNASGDLVVLIKGSTSASTTRYYQVYFDTAGSFSAPSFTSLVTTTSTGITDETYDSIRIATQNATYYYQKSTGGFSSILDTDGNDWVSWNPNGGSDGEFRGTPNHGPVGFHPGRNPSTGSSPGSQNDTLTTTVVSTGPLKTVIESTANTSGDKVRWEFYPNFARETVITMDQPYWFLYEGTPGGSISAGDTVVESDGTKTNVQSSTEWDHNHKLGAGNGEEWAYFRDADVNSGAGGRYMFFVHNSADDIVDSYYTMEGNMTVFGFARQNALDHSSTSALFNSGDTNNVFTIGFGNGGDADSPSAFDAASAAIEGAYKDLTLTTGQSGVRPS
jgi:hypothetical protein